MALLRSLFLSTLLVQWHLSDAAPTTPPAASLVNGPVIGVATSVPGASIGVNKFLGIPFAQSPPERFSPPTDAPKWTQPLQATAFKPACIQQFNYPASIRNEQMRLFNSPNSAPPAESEDCLYLNVYVPANAPTGTNPGLAVMVWIYGGNLIFGTGGIPVYDGASFAANQNVIVVTFNYRTNVFGFSGSPQVPLQQRNSGFLDQRKALAWVQANIAAFGGDPSKVTLFGESAGGFSIKQLVARPPSPLPFRGAILESAAAVVSSDPQGAWNQLVVLTACGTAASQIDCVRQIPATQIKNIIEQNGLSFGPVKDGVTYDPDTRTAFRTKTAAKVPLLFGTNADEGRVFAHLVGLSNNGYSTAQQVVQAIFPGNTILQNTILAFYPQQLAYAPYELLSKVITDYIYTCPTSAMTTLTAANGYNTWRYYYTPAFPNLSLFPNAGAWHSSEIPQVFGTYPVAGATTQQIQLSSYMQTTWANFAKNPSAGPGWPKIGSNFGKELGTLGENGSSGENTEFTFGVDYVCALYAPIIALSPL